MERTLSVDDFWALFSTGTPCDCNIQILSPQEICSSSCYDTYSSLECGRRSPGVKLNPYCRCHGKAMHLIRCYVGEDGEAVVLGSRGFQTLLREVGALSRVEELVLDVDERHLISLFAWRDLSFLPLRNGMKQGNITTWFPVATSEGNSVFPRVTGCSCSWTPENLTAGKDFLESSDVEGCPIHARLGWGGGCYRKHFINSLGGGFLKGHEIEDRISETFKGKLVYLHDGIRPRVGNEAQHLGMTVHGPKKQRSAAFVKSPQNTGGFSKLLTVDEIQVAKGPFTEELLPNSLKICKLGE